MAATSMNSALRYLRALFAGRQAGDSDQHLLEKFVGQADETAFAALLQRHGPMTMGACMRILHDEHLAEDALQATFLVLALKASSIRKTASVASWLYGVALRLARKLRAKTIRAQQQPARPVADPPPPPTEASRREEKELLDEELEHLPDKYRLPLLLCYFEGRSQEEAAAMRRGVTLSAASLATLLGETVWAATVSPRLALPTLKAAINLVSGKILAECGASASVVTLVKGGLTMGTKKILLILAALLMTATVGFAAVIWTGKISAPFGVGAGAQKQGEPGKAEGRTQEKGGKENREPTEDPIVDRLLEVLKNKSSSDEERARAVVALGKRGAKAKRGVSEVNKYLEDLLAKGHTGLTQKTTGATQKDELGLKTILQAAASVGANNKDTLEILARAVAGKNKDGKDFKSPEIQIAAIEGLRQLGSASEKAYKEKAKVELQVRAETDRDPQVRAAAAAAVDELDGKKLAP